MGKKVSLLSLAVPIFVELLFFALIGIVNMYILSRVSDQAAGAVGVCNQIINMTNLIFNIVSSGASVIISQYIGAKKKDETQQAIIGSFVILSVIGLICSVILFLFGGNILTMIGVTSGLKAYAQVYMKIFGGFIFTQALLNVSTVIMRSYGYAKETLAITAGMNVLNVVTVSILVSIFSDSPIKGMAGAAYAATFSRVVAMIMAILFVWKHILESDSVRYFKAFPGQIMKSLLKVGVPSALENLSYTISQIVITSIILTNLGEDAFITRSYILQIVSLVMIFGSSIAQANLILVGRLIGEGDIEGAYQTCLKSFRLAFFIAIGLGVVLFTCGGLFIKIFTTSATIIKWGGFTLMVGAFLEPGRTFNMVFINGLRGAGDVVYPVIMAAIFMWGCAVLGGYIIGVTLGFGLPGIWFAMVLDEWFRGLSMLHRWRSRKWAKKSLVDTEPAALVEA